MKFHANQMAEVNKNLKNLWISMYKGIDINYIKIESCDPDSDGPVSLSKRRNYNYQVKFSCFLCREKKLKIGTYLFRLFRFVTESICAVVAVLVNAFSPAFSFEWLWLKLFCINCGILALDEPTTNLDEANKYGLVSALQE